LRSPVRICLKQILIAMCLFLVNHGVLRSKTTKLETRIRVGKVAELKKLPLSGAHDIEQIDVGEPELWNIVSGLTGPFFQIEQMKGRLVFVLVNDIPIELDGGIMSVGSILCALR